MKQNYTDITFLLDRSGSMANCYGPTIEGYNAFLRDQQEVVGEATASLYQFDDRFEPNYVGLNVQHVPSLTKETYVPRGWTYLYEAMGKAIKATGDRLAAMPEDQRPSKVIFVALTDGREQHGNVERVSEFTREQVAAMVKQQTETYNWEFVFMGANQDAVLEGTRLGINYMNTMTYAYNPMGTRAAFASASSNVRRFREGGKMSACFEKEDYKKQDEAFKATPVDAIQISESKWKTLAKSFRKTAKV